MCIRDSKRLDRDTTVEALRKVTASLEGFEALGDEENEQRFRALAEKLGVKLGDLLMPVRIALTGSRVSPPLFESIRLLGIEKTASRIQNALLMLGES